MKIQVPCCEGLLGVPATASGEDWGEKPRVQLGVQYEGKVDILGRPSARAFDDLP